MAGYSRTPLVRKLGYAPGMRLHVVNAPAGFDRLLGRLDGVAVVRSARRPLDAIHLFTTSRRELARRLPRLLAVLQPAGMLWVSWPKQSAGVPSDVTEDVIRDIALPTGLVDVKVCAIDATWSGLKLVRRLRDR
jgi:hypothetical protein